MTLNLFLKDRMERRATLLTDVANRRTFYILNSPDFLVLSMIFESPGLIFQFGSSYVQD